MHKFKIGDRVRRVDNADPGWMSTGAYADGATGTVLALPGIREGLPGAFECYHVRVDGHEYDKHVHWHPERIAAAEPQRLVIDQVWAKLQAAGLTAQQVRAAIRNTDAQGGFRLNGWQNVLKGRDPLSFMFIWDRSPEGHRYWQTLNEKFR